MEIIIDKEKRPLILNNKEHVKVSPQEKPYKYSYKDSINKIKNTPAINYNNEIVNLDTLTEADSDQGDESFVFIDLDTMTKAFSDSGDEIRLVH